MNWNELFCQYVGKNVLNSVRTMDTRRTYQKLGMEDNEHLVEAMTELIQNKILNLLYKELKERYRRATKKEDDQIKQLQEASVLPVKVKVGQKFVLHAACG